MPVELLVDPDIDDDFEIDESRLAQAAHLIAQELADPRAEREVCVRICAEAVSRELNDTFRGKDKPTNVLSFPADVDLPECEVLGDLAICWPVVVREAQAQQKQPHDHLLHLFVHGVLHLLGLDHEDDGQAQEMEALEVLVLSRMGVADPYQL